MLKKILQASALASVLAMGVAPPASAFTEEDSAVPQGSFTSDMPAPMSVRAEERTARQQWFERHMRERMMHRASLERMAPAYAR